MKKKALTSSELKERALKNLRVTCNGLLGAFRFGEIQTPKAFAERVKLETQDYTHVLGDVELNKRLKFIEYEPIVKRWYEFEEQRLNNGAPAARQATSDCVVADTKRYKHTALYDYIEGVFNQWSSLVTFQQADEWTTVEAPIKVDSPDTILPVKGQQLNITLFPFQARAANEIWHWLFSTKHSSCLLEAPTGTGKTYIYGRVIRAIEDSGYAETNSISPWPIVLVTKASIVEQTKRVLRDDFGLDVVNRVHVINIEQLRSAFGETFIREETVVRNGDIQIVYHWKKFLHPVVIIWDECHILKNCNSTQSEIAQAYQKLLEENTLIKQIFASATPFMCVAETKVFSCSTRIPYLEFGGAKMPLRLADFSSWSAQIAAPAHPLHFSPAAMERYMKRMEGYIIFVKGVRPQFKARNSIKLINFRYKKWELFYQAAWEKYLEKLAKINRDAPGGNFAELVAKTMFRIAAEYAHAHEHMAEDAAAIVKQGYAAVIGCSFKPTIAAVVSKLVKEFGIPRDKISLIWGGAANLTKNLMSDEEGKELLKKISTAGKVSAGELKRLEDWLNYKDATPEDKEAEAETRRLYSELGLGPQSKEERQREIDRFQAGKTLVCIFTYKSGGVGLSLHHSDVLTKEKVRKQKNGWAVVEDIPLVPVRPRVTRLFPTWSAIEWAQGMGRAARLTSLSDTEQAVMGYRGTVEVGVLACASKKLKCLKKVVHNSEAFDGAIYEIAKGNTTMEDLKRIENEVETTVEQEELDDTGNTEEEE